MARRAEKLSPFWAERLYPSAFVKSSPLAPVRQLPSELQPRSHSPAAIRQWITAICRRLNVSPTELAKKAELAPSTVNRFISGNSKNENISATTINKLSDAAVSIYNGFMERAAAGDITIFEELEVEMDWGGESTSPFSSSVLKIPVVGFVNADYWATHLELPKDERYEISVPVTNTYRKIPLIGLEMRGGTVNTKYPNKSILICAPFYALDRDPLDGEFVVVNRKNHRSEIETIVREYRKHKIIPEDKHGSSWLLCLDGENPWQPPISLDDIKDDTLVVSLLIISSYQPERRRFWPPNRFRPQTESQSES